MSCQPHYGKYRGKVVNNIDPMMLGRIIPLVPAISESPLGWATPCVPYAGMGVGFFALPPIAANVWIEFEGGDVGKPIWSGCFWGTGEVPALPALPTTKVFKTETMSLTMNTLTSEFKLEMLAPSGMFRIAMDATGITLSNNLVNIRVAQTGITLTHLPATVSVAPQGVSLRTGVASADVAPQSVSLRNGPASVDVMPAAVSIKNGAASVDLTPVSVSLNKGALEVI